MEEKEVRELFLRWGIRKEKKKHQYIYDPSLSRTMSEAYYLDEGIAALTSISREGEEKIFLYFGEQRIIGFAEILARKYRFQNMMNLLCAPTPFWITAKTACTYYVMTEPVFSRLMDKDPRFLNAVLKTTCLNYLEIINKFQHIQDVDKETMFCEWLLSCRIRRNGKSIIPKAFTFTEAARYLDMHPMTVSRIAGKLKQMGLIQRTDGCLMITDEQRLSQLIRERRSASCGRICPDSPSIP